LTTILTVGSSLPIGEANVLFDQILAEIGRREKSPIKKGPRILVDGACLDNIELIKLIEEIGGNVVADAICNGARDYFRSEFGYNLEGPYMTKKLRG
jgi:benzoyl-CoA reductase/2-hydroxyglutaryl-CoA dehydratase subunit BcrC/BadD/HgdB